MKFSKFVVFAFLFFSLHTWAQEDEPDAPTADSKSDVSIDETSDSGLAQIWKMIMETAITLAQNDPRALLEFNPEKCKDGENQPPADIPEEKQEHWQSMMDKLCGMGEDEQWLVYNLVQNQHTMMEKLFNYSTGMATDVMKDMCGQEVEGEESLFCVMAMAIQKGITGFETGSEGTCTLFDLAKIVSDPGLYFNQFGMDIENCLDADAAPEQTGDEEVFLCKELSTYKKTVDSFTALMDTLNNGGIPALLTKGADCAAEDTSDYCKAKRLLDSTIRAVETAEKWVNVTITEDLMTILKIIAGDLNCNDPINWDFCDSDLYHLTEDTMHAVNKMVRALTNDNGDVSIFSSIGNVAKEIESVNKYAVFGEAVFQLLSHPSMIKQFFIYQTPEEFCKYGDSEIFIICSEDMDPRMKEEMMRMIGAVWNPMYSQTLGALIDVATKPEAMGRVLEDTSLQFCTNGESIPESLMALCHLVGDREYNELMDFVVSAGSSLNAMAPVMCAGMSEYERVASLLKLILNETVINSMIDLAANEAECLMKDLDLGDIFDLGRFLPPGGDKDNRYLEEDDDDSSDFIPLIILILLGVVVLLLVLVLFMQYRLMKEIFKSRKAAALHNTPRPATVPNVYKSHEVDNIEKSIQVMNSDPLSVPRNLRQPSNMPPPPPVYKTPPMFNTPLPGSSDNSVKDFDSASTTESYTELVYR